MKKTLLICLSVLMIALVGCKKETNTWGQLKEGSVTVNVGDSVQLTFTHNGNECPQWSVDDGFYATVTNKGMVIGYHVGTCVVSVNGLRCTVNVTDKYEGKIYDPWQEDWDEVMDSAETVNTIVAYEGLKRGECKPEIECTKVPQLKVTEIRDTTFNPDGTYNIVVVNDTDTVGYRNVVMKMTFDYTAEGMPEYVEKVVYTFFCTRIPDEGDVYGSMLETCSMSSDNKGDDLEQFVDNRYQKSEDGKFHFYNWTASKACDIIREGNTIRYALNR